MPSPNAFEIRVRCHLFSMERIKRADSCKYLRMHQSFSASPRFIPYCYTVISVLLQLDKRHPSVIRMAPVHIYNSFEDVYRFIQILRKIVHGDIRSDLCYSIGKTTVSSTKDFTKSLSTVSIAFIRAYCRLHNMCIHKVTTMLISIAYFYIFQFIRNLMQYIFPMLYD